MQEIKEIVAQQMEAFLAERLELEPSQLRPDADLKMDLGLTSLDAVEIALFVKRTYEIEPDMEAVKAIITLQDLYDYIEKHRHK